MQMKTVSPANTGILGLLGFGGATTLLNLHNAGILELSVVILSMGLFMGGLLQLIAGIFELCHGNTFTGTAFLAYSMFWWSLVVIWLAPFDFAEITGASGNAMGAYLLFWCLFTLVMFCCSLKLDRATQVVFGSLTVLFLLLALENFTGVSVIGMIAGIVGIFCGLSAIYAALGILFKGTFGRDIFPLG